MTKDEIKAEIARIEAIHKNYLDQLFELKKKQDQIVMDFSELLKNKKIEQLKEQLEKL